MANIVKLTGCKDVSHDIYAYFTCDAEKALKALELEIPCTGANSTGAYNIYFNDDGEIICEYMTFCVTREFKKVSSIQDAVEWMDKKMKKEK
jgi:hypothetical protein